MIIDKNVCIGDNVILFVEGKFDGIYDYGVIICDGVMFVFKGGIVLSGIVI